MDNRGGEENCKAVANRLRKIRRVPAERIPLTPSPEHAKRRSNASCETKHRAPAAFRELPSWLQRVAQRTYLCENKIARPGPVVPDVSTCEQVALLRSCGGDSGGRLYFCSGSHVGCAPSLCGRHARRYSLSALSVVVDRLRSAV